MNLLRTFGRGLRNWRTWAHGLFWSWNLIFVAFMLFGFTPTLLPELLRGVREGFVPNRFFVYGVVLALIPVLSTVVGFVGLRRAPARLFALGYAVEGPLMLLLAVRFFVVRQVTPAIGLLLALAAVGLATLCWRLLDRRCDERAVWLRGLSLLGMSLLLLTSLYAVVWLLFYILPVVIFFAESLTRALAQVAADLPAFFSGLGQAIRDLLHVPPQLFIVVALGFTLVAYTATLVVLMPIAVPIIVARAWRQSLRALSPVAPAWRIGVLPTGAAVAFALIFVLALRQPQQRAFDLLRAAPQDADTAAALLEQREAIREGLLNAYLAPQRYVSAHGDVHHIREIYEEAFNLSRARAEGVQRLYEAVVSPLLYRPVHFDPEGDIADALDLQTAQAGRFANAVQQDAAPAAELYATFFDRDILDAERETVVNAVRNTWDATRAAAGWQAVDDREVHLLRQEVTITEAGDWADIELYEVYQNQTTQRQEVVYYFRLPESAAVTGVWLGNSADRSERFAYRVAPRGAAQAVYQNEVRRRVDPALVEQIGPQQYRLRVFPIEPQVWTDRLESGAGQEKGPPLHMWLTYRVLAQPIDDAGGEASWPLPRLSDLRNVYWNSASERLLTLVHSDGQSASESLAARLPSSIDPGSNEAWLPTHIERAGDALDARTHRVDFATGQSVFARPAEAGDMPLLDALAGNLRLAVVLDRSRSMAEQRDAVASALSQLSAFAPDSDLFLTASPFRGEAPAVAPLSTFAESLTADEPLYYGGQNAAELLIQFAQLATHSDAARYDAILVLTDGGGYEAVPDGTELPTFDAPLWMVHLGGNFPPGYDDATLEAIQSSGGGAAVNVQTALTRLAVRHAPASGSGAREGDRSRDLVDGYLWQVVDGVEAAVDAAVDATPHEADDSFAALAARRLILDEMQRQRQALAELETLDALHAIAIEQSIVTPYSSMIVLVTERQNDLLDRLEGGADRFDREFEDVGETDAGVGFDVTGVPEPEEWLLIALSVAMLGWYCTKRRWTHVGADG